MAPPTPPMGADWEPPRRHLDHHDHAVVLFEQENDLLAPLASFVEEGLRKRDLIVFIHSFPEDAQAWDFLRRARPDAPALRESEVVLISVYHDAFEGSAGRIDHGHVAQRVAQLSALGRERDRAGVRIFVDASRRYFAAGRVDEWFGFESWLGRRLQAQVALVCAYQADDLRRGELLARALETHEYRFAA